MKNSIAILLLAGVSTTADAGAQEPVTDLVQRVIETGVVGQSSDEVLLSGCPQQNDRARTLVQAFSNVELPPFAAYQLARSWRPQYEGCDYPPLEDWYLDAFKQISGSEEDGGALLGFLESLPTEVPEAMRAALIQASEDDRHHDSRRSAMASRAVAGLAAAERVRFSVAAFGRNVPSQWIHQETQILARTVGGQFFHAVATEGGNLDDVVMTRIGLAVASDIRDGYVTESSRGLSDLRSYLNLRPGVSPEARLPRIRGG